MSSAIESKWECPACGNVITRHEVLTMYGRAVKFTMPEKCSCGRKGAFKLINFEAMTAMIVKKSDEQKVLEALSS